MYTCLIEIEIVQNIEITQTENTNTNFNILVLLEMTPKENF